MQLAIAVFADARGEKSTMEEWNTNASQISLLVNIKYYFCIH
jgi:hypothetical protein